MKKTILLILLMILSAAAFAQESEYYPKTVRVVRVYTHSLGYAVDFMRQDRSIGSFWAPVEWFRATGNDRIGEIAYGEGSAYPYMSVFYKDGEVSHFRLYLYESLLHESWGDLDPNVDYTDRFPPVDSKPDITF